MNDGFEIVPCVHQGVLSDAQVHAEALRVSALPCIVSRGGVLAMHPLLIHASSKLLSNDSRRVIHFEYSAALEFEPGMRLRTAA